MDREITQFINFSTWDDYRWYFSGDARDYFVRRGELVPVLDFERILYNRSSNPSTARIIVLNTDVVNYGLLVTEAREILDFDESVLQQLGLVNYSKTRYFTAVAYLENRMITYVDPKILVNSLDGIREIINYLHKMLENEKENVES